MSEPTVPLVPSPQQINDFHRYDDLDGSARAHHHTLGYGPFEVAPGKLVDGRLTSLEGSRTADEARLVALETTADDELDFYTVTDLPLAPSAAATTWSGTTFRFKRSGRLWLRSDVLVSNNTSSANQGAFISPALRTSPGNVLQANAALSSSQLIWQDAAGSNRWHYAFAYVDIVGGALYEGGVNRSVGTGTGTITFSGTVITMILGRQRNT